MESYHVYFTAKEAVLKNDLIAQVHEFMRSQVSGNRARAYRILEMTNKGSFKEMPDYHLIVDYESVEDVQEAFKEMKRTYKNDPHAPLMRMVSDFRVAFSTDANQPSASSYERG